MDMPNYDDLFKIIKVNLWLLGTPYGQHKINIRFLFSLIIMVLMIIAQSAFIFSKVTSVNFLEITQLVPCTCSGTLSCLKILPLVIKRRKLFELTESLSHLYNTIRIDSEKGPQIRSQLILLKKVVDYFFILNVILMSVYTLSPPVIIFYIYQTTGEAPFVLSFQVVLPFEVNSWAVWGLLLAYAVSAGFFCLLYYATTDILYCVLTTHVCANFNIISNKIQQLNKNNVHLLKEIIKDHQNILKLSEDLDDIFTWPNLFNVLVGSLEICALGFNLAVFMHFQHNK